MSMLPRHLCRLAARSSHHLSTRVLLPRQAKSWPSSDATHFAAAPRTHLSMGHLPIPSPMHHCILLLHTHTRGSAFLCRHCHRAHLVAAPLLRTTGAAAKGLNGSALAPSPPSNLVAGVVASQLHFSFSPPVMNSATTTSPFDLSLSGEPLAPFFLEELP
jgi:hypothetical protein